MSFFVKGRLKNSLFLNQSSSVLFTLVLPKKALKGTDPVVNSALAVSNEWYFQFQRDENP